jgi:hypothetical protein
VAELITVDDLPVALQNAADSDHLEMMVAGANAKASRVAPCLPWADVDDDHPAPSSDQLAEARLVLVGAVKRWHEAGSGAVQSEQIGPFGQTIDTRQRSTGYNLWPSEIEQLQDICSSGTDSSGSAFSIRPYCGTSAHLPWCSLSMGAAYCSCGVDIAGYPIYELTGDEY